MYVVIVGMGEVGRYLVQTLEWERHRVVAIDQDPHAISYIESHHDVLTLTGYGANRGLLRRAGAAKADLFVACTDSDETNLIAAMTAREMGAKRTLARVQGIQWAEGDMAGVTYGMLGVDLVFNPMLLLAQGLAQLVLSHGTLEIMGIANNRLAVAQLELGESHRFLQKPLSKLGLPQHILVAAVVRDRELFIPGGADVLMSGDRVYLMALPEQMNDAEDLFARRPASHRLCIVGGGVVGEALARQMGAARSVEVVLIEKDQERARELAAELPSVTVVHGDGTDLKLLEEERLGTFQWFCAVTPHDEVNLMAGLLAKRVGVDRTAARVQRPEYAEVYRQLGIDVVVSPRAVASDHILRYCRQSELQRLTLLEGGKAEILEILAMRGSRIVGVPVKRLSFPRGALLGAILKKDEVVLPGGEDQVAAGDTVIIITTPAARAAVSKLFRPRAL